MNVASLVISLIICGLAVDIQLAARQMLIRAAGVRRDIISSWKRCPDITARQSCDVRVAARRGDIWDLCDADHPPSGADLPMHRWFRVSGHCEFTVHGIHMSLPLPAQLVYR